MERQKKRKRWPHRELAETSELELVVLLLLVVIVGHRCTQSGPVSSFRCSAAEECISSSSLSKNRVKMRDDIGIQTIHRSWPAKNTRPAKGQQQQQLRLRRGRTKVLDNRLSLKADAEMMSYRCTLLWPGRWLFICLFYSSRRPSKSSNPNDVERLPQMEAARYVYNTTNRKEIYLSQWCFYVSISIVCILYWYGKKGYE